MCNDLLLYNSCIIVPKPLQQYTMDQIHQAIQRCQEYARCSIWWPGISSDIQEKIQKCSTYSKKAIPRKKPMICSKLPDSPWQKIGTDLFEIKGVTYLLVVDYFSHFPEVIRLTTTTSSNIITSLKSLFARYGIPEEEISDNGPQYISQEMKDFADTYGFKHTSSPYNPQGNGLAERTVKTVKSLW